jgi:RNA polymerase sigma factor (sigma-70 family)
VTRDQNDTVAPFGFQGLPPLAMNCRPSGAQKHYTKLTAPPRLNANHRNHMAKSNRPGPARLITNSVMNDRGISRLLDYLRRAAPPGADLMPDGVLLGKYADARDEAAFELLVRRHGPLVWSAVRRVLRDEHAAEDALQATFLALARKAQSLRGSSSVAGWLYRVGVRIALRARPKARPMLSMPEADGDPAIALERMELIAVVDEEVNRLPERLRQAVVLCCLGGASAEEAAQRLGCPRGTILSRLHAAREKLRQQLARRGFEAAAVGPLLAECGPAPLSSSLIAIAVRAAGPAAALSPVAITLAQGALTAMLMTKVKVAALVLVAAAGLGVGANHWSGAVASEPQAAKEKPAAAKVEDAKPNANYYGLAQAEIDKRIEMERKAEQERMVMAEDRLWRVIGEEEQKRERLHDQLWRMDEAESLRRHIDAIIEAQKPVYVKLVNYSVYLSTSERELDESTKANDAPEKIDQLKKNVTERRDQVNAVQHNCNDYERQIVEIRTKLADLNLVRAKTENQIKRSELREQLELEKYRRLLK